MRLTIRAVLPAITILFTVFQAVGPALAAPTGLSVESSRRLAAGVMHQVLVGDAPPQRVHVARIDPNAPFVLRAVSSGGSVAETKERPSAACRRTSCLVAVNADFWVPGTEEPLGALATLGEMLRSPNASHHQLVIGPDGDLDALNLGWTARVVSTDLATINLHGVNRPRGLNQVILFTPEYASTTRTNPHGVELLAQVVEPLGPVRSGQTARLRLLKANVGQGSSPLPDGAVVLSGHGEGAKALSSLWARVEAGDVARHVLLRIETSVEVGETVGGTPILLKDGTRWFAPEPRSFFTGRHPRTVVGWNPDGVVWLVTIDGRQPGYAAGMTMTETAQLMLDLGATDAINLDGGGSTTFVVSGEVANRPSDRVVRRGREHHVVAAPGRGDAVIGNAERPVVVVLALVPRILGGSPTDPVDPLNDDVGLPLSVALGDPSAVDPGSDPQAALPELVVREPRATGSLALAALVMNFGATLVVAVAIGYRRHHPSPASVI